MIPVVLLLLFPLVAAGVIAPPGLNWILIGVHLLLLFAGALLCHTRLAESRPEPQQLTEFYFWIALGRCPWRRLHGNDCAGGFQRRIRVSAAGRDAAFLPRRPLQEIRSAGLPPESHWRSLQPGSSSARSHLDSDTEAVAFAHSRLSGRCIKLSKQPQRFAWSFAVLMLAYTFILPGYIEGANRVYAERNFFGVKKVLDEPDTHLRKLLHGDTIHGIESTDPGRVGQPLSYYYPGGSVSDVIDSDAQPGKRSSASVCSDWEQERWLLTRMRLITSLFTKSIRRLSRSRDNTSRFFALRLQLRRHHRRRPASARAASRTASFDLLLLDAFSSDSVPTHLVSREALQMYLAKLKPEGVLLFHVSNRYLNVEKLVSALVKDAGLVAFSRFDDAGDLRKLGKSSANHLVAARRLEDLEGLAARPGWSPSRRPPIFNPGRMTIRIC